ncbi:Hsp33 family molecular chaperone HslO [Thiohalocapsa marina]|uniref:33 kDa chaperonin n=1 Tax=Thiohalocapsa marina TaxID=424902 RepID=A0A5M8FT02_9GAMM|nr:Hsp33 family molecular chaperone HslO [Thiohalocapsa marina]KAA6186572.1 Hsp33 family molecular chaperone HslO [Thiohalocapsa marina]
MTIQHDNLHRFVFERLGVRGELAYLDATWQAVLERHPYPAPVQRPLGEALAGTLLLTATLKFEGSLILQIQGDGPIRSLVAQATHGRTVRGLARWHDPVTEGTLAQQFGDGRLVLTLDPLQGERYQGIVPLEGDGIGAAIEAYFAGSEQLPTRLWLAVDGQRAVGLMLQQMPGPHADEDGWNRTTLLADTVEERELLQLPVTDLLRRLFHEEDVRLFEPEPVAFRCSCSRTRIADTLRALGPGEVDAIIAERGHVNVTCEFCNRDYSFDPVDARELFTNAVVPSDASTLQH